MGRFFAAVILGLALTGAGLWDLRAQHCFFSLLFPQLMPCEYAQPSGEATPGEAVLL